MPPGVWREPHTRILGDVLGNLKPDPARLDPAIRVADRAFGDTHLAGQTLLAMVGGAASRKPARCRPGNQDA